MLVSTLQSKPVIAVHSVSLLPQVHLSTGLISLLVLSDWHDGRRTRQLTAPALLPRSSGQEVQSR